MDDDAVKNPYRAIFRLDLSLAPLPPSMDSTAWDELMELLLVHPGIIDPIVSDDMDTGSVSVSFEFEATGNAQADGLRAVTLLSEATRTVEPTGAYEAWLRASARGGTVQYPLPA